MDALAVEERVDEATEPLRRCVATGESLPQSELLRFVVDPEGRLLPDFGARLPGRGLWVSLDRDLLRRAVERRAFARAARREVKVPSALEEQVSGELRRRALKLLGLAGRAGAVAAGHDKARAWLEKGRAVLLLQACDGAPEPRVRMANLGRGRRPALKVIECFSAAELGEALGRGATVHVAVAPQGGGGEGIAGRIAEEARRLARFERQLDVKEGE